MSNTILQINGQFGFGSMSLTWTPNPKPIEESVDVMKYAANKYNVRFINGGEFYGPDNINLKYLQRFWAKYGFEYPDMVISVKGAINTQTLSPDGSKDSISRSIENFTSFFPSEKSKRPKLIFEIARVDPHILYEKSISYIQEYVEKGVIDGISLSEVGVGSIQKAINTAPISCVEIEFSLLCQDIFENGVLEELSSKGIQVIAYSPLCRGFLTDKSANDLNSFYELCHRPGDIRSHCEKFSKENFYPNLKVVLKLQELARKKGVSLECLALSWILSISCQQNFNGIDKIAKILPIPSSSSLEKTDKNFGLTIVLSKKDLYEIKSITDANKVQGLRYNSHAKHLEFA